MLTTWSDFFTLTGTAGATLLGLLFVVVTLGTDLSTSRKLDVARASMTPALYSFTGVLLQSMVVQVPWRSYWPSGVIFVVMGIVGIIYRINAIRVRSRLRPLSRAKHRKTATLARPPTAPDSRSVLASTPLRFTPRRTRSVRRFIPLRCVPAAGPTGDWREPLARKHGGHTRSRI